MGDLVRLQPLIDEIHSDYENLASNVVESRYNIGRKLALLRESADENWKKYCEKNLRISYSNISRCLNTFYFFDSRQIDDYQEVKKLINTRESLDDLLTKPPKQIEAIIEDCKRTGKPYVKPKPKPKDKPKSNTENTDPSDKSEPVLSMGSDRLTSTDDGSSSPPNCSGSGESSSLFSGSEEKEDDLGNAKFALSQLMESIECVDAMQWTLPKKDFEEYHELLNALITWTCEIVKQQSNKPRKNLTRGILNILDISSTTRELENSKTPEIDELVEYFIAHYNGWMEKGNLTEKKKQNLHKTFTIMVYREKHQPDEIKQVIDWLATGQSWWGDKIDAGYKFQEHYDPHLGLICGNFGKIVRSIQKS